MDAFFNIPSQSQLCSDEIIVQDEAEPPHDLHRLQLSQLLSSIFLDPCRLLGSFVPDVLLDLVAVDAHNLLQRLHPALYLLHLMHGVCPLRTECQVWVSVEHDETSAVAKVTCGHNLNLLIDSCFMFFITHSEGR